MARLPGFRPFVLSSSLLLAGCIGSGTLAPPGSVEADEPLPMAAPTQTGSTIGAGSIRVALILPLSSPGQGAVVAQSLHNAAELAVTEFENPDVTILVKDDAGTAEGAREAARAALNEGAELVIGPLFAPSVRSVAQVVRPAGKPVVAFSTDVAVAAPGVYLLSFLAQAEVDRIVAYAASQGRRSMVALIPQNTYGSVVEAAFNDAAARHGVRIAAVERYPAGQPQAAVQRLAPFIGGASQQADALFLPENADGLPAVAQALQIAGFNPQRVKPLGTGVWNETRVFSLSALQGGWFAAPDNRGFDAFAGRYRARFGTDPTRLATLSYDAVSLAAALARTQGAQRFSEAVLTNRSGFAGADGVFRFRPDGTNDRTLAVQEIRNNAAVTVDAAPRALAGT